MPTTITRPARAEDLEGLAKLCTRAGTMRTTRSCRRRSRGTGLARALIAEAEARLASLGVARAWLACAVGNDRAARFYEKCGWSRARVRPAEVAIEGATLHVDVWIYEKSLALDQ